MGVSTSPLQLAGKMFAAGTVVRTASTVGVEAGALAFKNAAKAAFPARLSGAGRRGANLNARYTGGKYADGAKYLVFMTGPAHLVERDTRAHQIPRSRTRGRRRYAAFGGQVYSRVSHPGTKGKHPWAKTEAVMLPLIPKIIETGTVAALKRIF